MSRLQALREEKAGYLARVEAIAKIAEDDKRDQTPDEIAEVTALLDKAEAVAPKIAHEERVAKAMSELAVKTAPPAPSAPAVHAKNRKAPKGWDSYEEAHIAGAWLSANVLNSAIGRRECQTLGVQAAMSEGSNVDGGYLVPVELSTQIIRQVEEYGIFPRFARAIPMTSDRYQFTARTSGVTGQFVGENPSSLTESSPQFNQREMIAKRFQVLTKFSRDVAEDAFADIAGIAAQEAALAIAIKQDACGFIGDGSNTYGGMVGIKGALAAGSIYTAITGNTAFGTLDLADFESMIALLPNFMGLQPRWFISRQGYYASMSRLQMAAGGNTVQDFGTGPVLQFLGFPVTLTQSMNTVTTAQTSTAGLVHFGDLSMAASVGTRRGVTLQIAREKFITENQIGLYWDTRFAISVHEVGDASNPGPIVSLSTPGS